MAEAALPEARRLVAASVQAQAQWAGLWQQHRGLQWWQSGLPAMAGNLVVGCDSGTSDRQLQALARLLGRGGVPAGWLLWPDQVPQRQGALLRDCGFGPCERIWLASLAAADLPGAAAAQGCRVLGATDRPALATLLQACHGVPAALAAVVAAAFAAARPLPLAGGRVQLQTFAVGAADASDAVLLASITALLWQPQGAADAGAQPSGALLWLGTHPDRRRLGHGTRVTAAACRWLQQQGAVRLYVQASAEALSIYRGLGFAEDGWLELWGRGG